MYVGNQYTMTVKLLKKKMYLFVQVWNKKQMWLSFVKMKIDSIYKFPMHNKLKVVSCIQYIYVQAFFSAWT